jgi:parvulin-like peptidyl-prolyl isomerase
MDEGPEAMDGSAPQTHAYVPARSASRRNKYSWLWTAGSLVVVVAAGIAIRLVAGPQAVAQAPQQPAGNGSPIRIAPTAPSTPSTRQAMPAAVQPNQTTTAPRAGAPTISGVQPATMTKSSPPPSSTLQVMAVVNGEQITRTDLGRECIRRYGDEVLESMVNRQLIADACAQKGIQVSDNDVSAEIDKVAGRFGLSRDRWLTLLREERGFGEEQYRREVLWPMLALRQLVASEIDVTDVDLKKAFESEFGPKVRARLIAMDDPQKAAQVRAMAMADPNSFGELSKKNTIEPGVASAYGVIPPIRRHLGDPHLEQVAFSLKQGQISEVVHVANMYYILKCEEVMPPQLLSNQQIAEQQSRMKEKIKENKLRTSAGEFFEKRKADAKISLLVGSKADPQLQQQNPGVAAIVNGKQLTLAQLADECITRHGNDVLEGEINRKILQQELNRKRVTIDSPDIDTEVSRAADAYGMVTPDGKPDVERWLKSITEQPGATVDIYVRDAVWPSVALKKLVGAQVQVADEDLRKSYESNYGERVELQAIVFTDLRQAQKVWDLARNNNTEPFFSELAQQYSVEPSSRSNGGKVPPIRRFGGSPVIEEEAFKLKAGDISGIVAVDGQFIIMRCLGRTKPVPTDFNTVRSELVKDIQEKKLRSLMTKEFDRLREVAQVDNFLAGTSQNGGKPASPVTLSPNSPPARVGSATPASATTAPRVGALPNAKQAAPAAGSTSLPRPVGQSR